MSDLLRNWAGNITFSARRLHRPSSVSELQRLVSGSERVRALGTGHSFNRIADSSGDLVSVADLPKVLDIDVDNATVTVGAGMRYGEVVGPLQLAGYALPNLGSLPHIAIAGACATGTHGSGDDNGILATAASALEMVTAEGGLVALRRDADPDVFPGAVVALGSLGILTRLTLDIVPTYQVRQYVYEGLPVQELAEHFAEILSSAYSVSLFTDWRTLRINQAWCKHRVDAESTWTPPRRWMGAALAAGPRHPVPGMSPVHATAQLGEPGPWNERLPHFRLEFTPSSGEEIQSEYVLPRHLAVDALHAVAGLRHLVAPVLQIAEIRTIAADDLWLSPSYGQDSAAFHFTWIKDTEAVTPVVTALEHELAPFAARPHWAKLFTTSPETVSGLYERFADFQGLLRRYDPAGKFRNEFMDRHFPVYR